ncbi:4-hydroxy-tetrahydrodipicolinate reductase [Alphaproteobacteria bacterium KMM 3653]|uniref:4-hydroxy-tetrahydrodipicolinate reductase n=1 Tax=Harenicola maris TaxID=2841044 RepID=A0AAP2CP00_9RHOB|nr:4-hydroxy-tetrahydrodipicolinate reductase [Harenicola maris]
MTQTDSKTGIVIAGASGRMGQMLTAAVLDHPALWLAGALERPGHEWIGRDLGEAMGQGALSVTVSDQMAETLKGAGAVIDFTAPVGTRVLAEAAAQAGCAHIIGTTGMTEEDIAAVDACADRAVIVRAGNMSLGVNLLMQLTKQVAAALDADFDIEVVEAHHRHKVDAPSGTALMLGEAAAEGRGLPLADVYTAARDGITGARERGSIGFSAIRGGDIIGEHDVIFAGEGERIVLTHKASDRSLFANGALKAAIWAQGRAPGHYDMLDVLGLKA